MNVRILLFVCTIFIGSDVLAINKCVDDKGKTSFQDKPCPKTSMTVTSANTSTEDQKSLEVNVVELTMGNSGVVSIPIPEDWSVNVNPTVAPNTSTMKATTSSDEGVTLLVTAIQLDNPISPEEKVNLIDRIRGQIESQYQSYGSTKKLESRPIEQAMNDGSGHLYTFVDENLLHTSPLPSGESIYVTAGVIVLGNTLLTTTILANSIETESYVRALAAIHFVTN